MKHRKHFISSWMLSLTFSFSLIDLFIIIVIAPSLFDPYSVRTLVKYSDPIDPEVQAQRVIGRLNSALDPRA